jgi:hypothetical protein
VVRGGGRIVSWDNLRTLIEAGVPAVEPIAGSPALEVFVDAAGLRIGLRAPLERVEAPPIAGYADLRVALVELRGHPHVELSTSARDLYHEFHSLVLLTAALIQEDGLPPLTAISDSLRRWRQLVATRETLTAEERLGLLGELWVLRRILATFGPSALDAWVGPRGEPHDFRLAGREFEVKTTIRAGRVHTVHGLKQLQPTAGSQLFLLSLQVAPAGAEPDALALSGLVADIEAALDRDTPRLDLFRWLVGEQVGYRPGEAPPGDDVEALILRSAPLLVPVDEHCPAITGALLEPLGARKSLQKLVQKPRVVSNA